MNKYNYRFFELYTSYGTLYIYRKESEEKNEKGYYDQEYYEFFTGERGIPEYKALAFYGGKSKFDTQDIDFQGNIRREYLREVSPYDFLMKVGGYVGDKEVREEKAKEIHDIFDRNARKIKNTEAIFPNKEVSKEQKDYIAKRLLKLYTK